MLISPYNALSDDDKNNRYYDAESQTSFTFDHIKHVCVAP